jgi:riboflavin kinase/FMN adenylyltransferase
LLFAFGGSNHKGSAPVHIVSCLTDVLKPSAVAIGNFDGVHLGHQEVLRPIIGSSQGIRTILTFYPHPQEVLTGESRLLLTPQAERILILDHLGIEQVIQLPFTPELSRHSPQQFIDQILDQGLQVRQLSVGSDFRFAYQRTGTAEDLLTWGKKQGIYVDLISDTLWQGERISSSRIRLALQQGKVELAQALLGRPYRLWGEVVAGDQRGRQLGFPTANLMLPVDKYLPCDGVYSAWVRLLPEITYYPAVLNIGIRPTVAGKQRTVEVHLLNWEGDLYGQSLEVNLVHFIRPEQKFASLTDLISQIQKDCDVACSQLLFV